ncbi:MAG: YdcF family protein [Anaerolineaceae bacterium]|nr:YdcF family protein [Anaerolineaceae bacterium]
MFVYLSKLLPLLVYPLGLSFIILIIAMSLHNKKPRASVWMVAVVFILICLAGNRIISASLARSLESRYQPSGQIPAAPVIVLLGGGTESGDFPRPTTEINSAGDRVLYAAWLYRLQAAPNILLSGGNLEFSEARESTPAQDMANILALLYIPPEVLWFQELSQNTYEDAFFSAEILRSKGISEIILVTSAMHMPRAVAVFEKQGLKVIPAPTDFTITEKGWKDLTSFKAKQIFINLLPNASSLSLTTNVLKEYLGMLVYRMHGWMELDTIPSPNPEM